MAAILTRDIVKKFGEVPAVDGISLTVPDGEFMVLLGPSGCGKTTFLRIICGLEKLTSGDLLIGSDVVNDIPPRARGVAMMFQSTPFIRITRCARISPSRCGHSAFRTPRLKGRSSGRRNCPALGIFSIGGRVNSPAASGGGSRSYASRPHCCSTSRSRTSTRNCAPRRASRSSSSSSGSASPPFM